MDEAGKTHARASAPGHRYYAAVKDRQDGRRAALSEARKILRQACHILAELGGQFTGKVISGGDPGYDQARRVWNGMIDRYPRAVIRASGHSDIAAAVRLAAEHELPLAVRGGGHSVAGHGTVDDGLVLDLGALRAVEVDPGSRTVRAGPGATLADVDRATGPHGLAVQCYSLFGAQRGVVQAAEERVQLRAEAGHLAEDRPRLGGTGDGLRVDRGGGRSRLFPRQFRARIKDLTCVGTERPQ